MGQNQSNTHPLYTKVGEENGRTIVKAGGRLYQLRVCNYPDEDTSAQRQKQLKQGKELINDHLIALSHYEAQTDSNFCSTFHKICLLFEYLPHTLATEIMARRDQQNKFSDKQLWSILCSTTLAFSYLQQHDVQIQCFNLKDVMLSDDGIIKINSPFNTGDNCSSTIFDPSYFYSPEQLEGGPYNKAVSGVYQLGLALLTCIDLNPEEQFYTKNGYIDFIRVSQRLKNALRQVNKDLSEMLTIMLNKDQNHRPDWITLEKYILSTIQNPQKPTPPQNVRDLPVVYGKQIISNPSIGLNVDTSDESSLLCYESEPDEEKMDQNSNDMVETNRFEEETVLKQSRKQQSDNHDTQFKKHKKVSVPEVVNQEFEGGKYEGQKVNGFREGYGTFHYSQGGIYTGQWHLNKMEGQGCLYYPSGKLAYEGQWRSDKLDGHGTLYNEDVVKLKEAFDYRSFDKVEDCWVKYQGGFQNDNKEGKGKLVLSNGEWFIGYFSQDRVHGEGQFFRKDGSKITGQWNRNKLIR